MFRSMAITLALCLTTFAAQAALLGRAPLTLGGTDYQAYYDDEWNITWIADANRASTSFYALGGAMTWNGAQGWISSLNTTMYLGKSDWRLPTVLGPDTPSCGDVGIPPVSPNCNNEMAHLFYDVLGNSGLYDRLTGQFVGCNINPPFCLTNRGPFSHIQNAAYWTEREAFGGVYVFDFGSGFQNGYLKNSNNTYAWAVRLGDIAPVPVPPAVWLFGSALGLMGVMRRRVTA